MRMTIQVQIPNKLSHAESLQGLGRYVLAIIVRGYPIHLPASIARNGINISRLPFRSVGP